MHTNCELTFDQFMLLYVNKKKSFKFNFLGLTLQFFHKNNQPALLIDDGTCTKEYKFKSDFEICRLSFNGVPFSALFKKLTLID